MTTVEGLAKISPAGIVLEFEKKLFGLLKEDVREIRIPVGEIIGIKLKSGVFNSKIERYLYNKLELRLNNLARLEGLPFKGGAAMLKIKRADLDSAEQAVAIIDAALRGSVNIPGNPQAAFPAESPLQRMLNHDDTETLELVEPKRKSK